ncbi:MAG: tRNA pseudouridine(55) synthase TruB [Deltaproteobacteria bacterium]|nr:tRNA pseudouridine(55) synthase TruB [Deltaproteobacteria bacterium]
MNGVLLVDKEPGMTSHDVVARARRTLGIRSIGHAGTLDPLASGLLLLLVGEATKISDYLLNGDKSYEVTVRMGLETDSMDITGKVLKETSLRDSQGQFLQEVSEARVREVSLSATGVLSLEVPVHSAVKVGGKKLYELAHKGERPEEVPVREMTFYGLQWLSWSPETAEFTMRISCSKGSFIRAWANYVGGLLGFGGTVSALRRVESAPFNVAKAKRLGTISDLWENRKGRSGEVLGSSWVPLDEALPHFGRIEVAGQDAALLKNGQISKAVQAELLRKIQLGTQPAPIRVIDREENRLLALLAAEPGEFYKIRRVFQP